MLSETTHSRSIKDAVEYSPLGARRRRWWQSTIMQRLSFALFVFALWSALLSSCVSTNRFSATSDAAEIGKVTFPDLYEASIAELQGGLEKGHFSSEDLVKVKLAIYTFE